MSAINGSGLRLKDGNTFLMLVALSVVSVDLITTVDRLAGDVIASFSHRLLPVAYARFPSFSICLALCFAFDRNALRFRFADTNWKGVIRAATFWLAPAAFGVFVLKVWVPRIEGWIDVTAFMLTGLCAEEFLFRGSLYSLAQSAFGNRRLLKLPLPVIYTAAFFSLQHLQYHGFMLTGAAQTQLIYTFAMGIFFGLVRSYGTSIWPVVAVHMLNNVFTLVRNFSN